MVQIKGANQGVISKLAINDSRSKTEHRPIMVQALAELSRSSTKECSKTVNIKHQTSQHGVAYAGA
jgi:hypothetical protein